MRGYSDLLLLHLWMLCDDVGGWGRLTGVFQG